MYDLLKKVLLILLLVMVGVFSVLYFFISRRYGVEDQDALFFPVTEGDATVYSAKIEDLPVSFTVEGDTVTYRWGDTVYGPYTVREDPTAAPGGQWASMDFTGVEVTEGDTVLFRGGYTSDLLLLIQEDGEWYSTSQNLIRIINGVAYDSDGDPIDPHKLTLSSILRFSQLPEPDAHRGSLMYWFFGLLTAGIAALFIKFDDRLFRWNLRFRIRDPESAEPSECEIFSRVFAWLLFTGLSFGLFIAGLILIN